MRYLKKSQKLTGNNASACNTASKENTMLELTFQEFHEQHYEPMNYCLYIMKNGLGDTLYIGISTDDVWGRWFGWGGHMMWDGKVIYGESSIGEKIVNHLPDSLQWKIQLWTFYDCVEFCRDKLPHETDGLTIRDLEPIMIQKMRPALNIIYNLNPGKDTTPKSKKEIEYEKYVSRMYDEIFNKKK
jgi:hypothetical protein